MADAVITHGMYGRTCRLAVRGTARFGLGARLEAFIRGLFADQGADAVEFDLTGTEYLDSTMLGLIARAARYSATRSGRRPLIYSTRDDVTFLLETTGFDACAELVPREPPDCGPMEELPPIPDTPRERVVRVLDAHRTLMRLNRRNETEFHDTVEVLERELTRHPDGPEHTT